VLRSSAIPRSRRRSASTGSRLTKKYIAIQASRTNPSISMRNDKGKTTFTFYSLVIGLTDLITIATTTQRVSTPERVDTLYTNTRSSFGMVDKEVHAVEEVHFADAGIGIQEQQVERRIFFL